MTAENLTSLKTQKSENKIVTSCQTLHKPVLPIAHLVNITFNSKKNTMNFSDTVLVINCKQFIKILDSML